MRPIDDSDESSVEDQELFWEGVGMLLYLMEHSRPDVANFTGKLSKAVDGTNQAAFLKMHHNINYILNMKNLTLKLEPSGNEKELLFMVYFSDRNYAEDPVKMRSVGAFNQYILGKPVS